MKRAELLRSFVAAFLVVGLWAGLARAQNAPPPTVFFNPGMSYNRLALNSVTSTPTGNVLRGTQLAAYSLSGTGTAGATLTRSLPVLVNTAAGRTVSATVVDAIKPGAGAIAKNVAKRVLPLSARLLTGTLGAAVIASLAASGIQYAVDRWTQDTTVTSDIGACDVGTGYQNSLYNVTQAQCAAAINATSNQYAHGDVHLCARPDPVTYNYCYYNAQGRDAMWGTWTFQRQGTVAGPPRDATEADMRAAIVALPPSDPKGSQALQWLKEAGYDFELDGTEQSSFTAPTVVGPGYSSSTTTNPNGTTTTTYTADKITPTQTAENGPVSTNSITYNFTTVTTTNAGGSTTITESTPQPPQQVQDANGCGNLSAGQPACATREQGTFVAPTTTLPVLGSARTFRESFQALWSGILASPLFSMADSLRLPSGAQCPVYTVSVDYLHRALTFDQHCPIAERVRGTLSVICLAVYGLLGIRRVLSA